MDTEKMLFHRLFSKTMYKNLKLPLGEMTFSKDFVTDSFGDLYPVIDQSADCNETVENNRYNIKSGSVERMFGSYFPYASYEIAFSLSKGACGLAFHIPNGSAAITCGNDEVIFSVNGKQQAFERKSCGDGETMIVSCRKKAFDVYFVCNGLPKYFCTFETDVFEHSNLQKIYQNGYVCLLASGQTTVTAVSFYIDCGISQADLRPIRYENGEVIYEQGKIYLTATVRMQEEMFQAVFGWTPSTDAFELTGALFYTVGDGYINGDVAASVLYNRNNNMWYLWVCSFAHQHIPAHSAFKGDPRFGVNIVDITLMKKADSNSDITDFVGFEGDEDPDFYYNESEKKWYMAICRLEPSTESYKYFFFKSDEPFDGYKYIGRGYDGAETGGSFVTVNGERLFICGNDYNKKSNYRIYSKEGLGQAEFDFPDGGFRGWGTVIPVEMGSRIRYFWLTFDRHNGSEYNWSYGNIYCFEAQM